MKQKDKYRLAHARCYDEQTTEYGTFSITDLSVDKGLPAEWFTSCRWVIPEVNKGAYNHKKTTFFLTLVSQYSKESFQLVK
jgi:hypothetical protein